MKGLCVIDIYHGFRQKKGYFEGWYFKHQSGGNIIAFIPGIHMDGDGNRFAFIQVLTGSESFNFSFSYEDFSVSKTKFAIKIGASQFSEDGISVDINQNGVIIRGRISYGGFTPIAYNIMGPFSILPMETNHAIHSLRHSLTGALQVRDRTYDFSGGTGYIEQDWGKSFPKEYLWLQTNDFGGKEGCLFLSVAQIPFLKTNFEGCICILYLNQKEYRMATYLGVRILAANDQSILLKQGKHLLHIELEKSGAQPLLAPVGGEMSRTIHESASTPAHIRFYEDRSLLLDVQCNTTSFEYVK